MIGLGQIDGVAAQTLIEWNSDGLERTIQSGGDSGLNGPIATQHHHNQTCYCSKCRNRRGRRKCHFFWGRINGICFMAYCSSPSENKYTELQIKKEGNIYDGDVEKKSVFCSQKWLLWTVAFLLGLLLFLLVLGFVDNFSVQLSYVPVLCSLIIYTSSLALAYAGAYASFRICQFFILFFNMKKSEFTILSSFNN